MKFVHAPSADSDACHGARQAELDFDNDDDVRTMLLVHDTKPPFLDGRVIFTKQVPLDPPPHCISTYLRAGYGLYIVAQYLHKDPSKDRHHISVTIL